jgi:hypothetical protein
MEPFSFRLFAGGVLYTGLVLGVSYGALEDWYYCLTHCISCCYEMLF